MRIRMLSLVSWALILGLASAASGAGGGFLTQLFTRGKHVKVPAETVLHSRLERPLVLQPLVLQPQ